MAMMCGPVTAALVALGVAQPAAALSPRQDEASFAQAADPAAAQSRPPSAAYGAPLVVTPGAANAAAIGSLRAEGASTADKVLTITFENLTATADSAPVVKVFLGKPDADAKTPVSDPHYVGSTSFFPLPADGPLTATLPVGRTVARLKAQNPGFDPATAEVTVVLAPTRDALEAESARAPSVDIVSIALTDAPQ